MSSAGFARHTTVMNISTRSARRSKPWRIAHLDPTPQIENVVAMPLCLGRDAMQIVMGEPDNVVALWG